MGSSGENKTTKRTRRKEGRAMTTVMKRGNGARWLVEADSKVQKRGLNLVRHRA